MAIQQQINSTSFLKSIESNQLRPYNAAPTEHDDPIATIILYSQNNSFTNTSTADQTTIDYLTNFSEKIKPLVPEANSSLVTNNSTIPDGDIPILSMQQSQDYYGVFNNFSVTNLSESHSQITKVHMNFSARWNVFFFGNTPNMYQVRGFFLDSQEYPYYQEFMVAFEKYLSGRKCVENHMNLKFVISGQIIDGYMLDITVSHNANTPTLKEFAFTILVKGSSWVRTNITHKGGIESGINSGVSLVYNGLSNLSRLEFKG